MSPDAIDNGGTMSEKLIQAIQDLVYTLQATNRLLRADQERRQEEQERAAQAAAEQRRTAQKRLEHQPGDQKAG